MNDKTREPTETLGERLRRLRKERGLSQQAISGPGLTTAHISRIEAGLRRPSVRAIRALAKKLDVSAEYLETGRDLGPRGDFEVRVAGAEIELKMGVEAAEKTGALRSLVDEARSLGDPMLTARAVAALGLNLHEIGEDAEAATLLAEASASAVITPSLRPEVFIALSQAYAVTGRRSDAVTLLAAALAFVEEHARENRGAYMRLAVNLSYALTDAGRVGESRELLEEAVREHGESYDHRAQIASNWTLGRDAAREGDSAAALEHMRRTFALLDSDENALAVGSTYALLGQILVVDGRLGEAETLFEQSLSLLEQGEELEEAARLCRSWASALSDAGRGQDAAALLDRATALETRASATT